jgi:hypothetical protein
VRGGLARPRTASPGSLTSHRAPPRTTESRTSTAKVAVAAAAGSRNSDAGSSGRATPRRRCATSAVSPKLTSSIDAYAKRASTSGRAGDPSASGSDAASPAASMAANTAAPSAVATRR